PDVAQRRSSAPLGAGFQLRRDDRFAADTLDGAAGQPFVRVLLDGLKVSRNELEFYCGAAGIENQNIHGSPQRGYLFCALPGSLPVPEPKGPIVAVSGYRGHVIGSGLESPERPPLVCAAE